MSSNMDTPGSRALEAVKKIKDLTIFKKPMGVPRRIKKHQQTTLDEETYIERMSEIIQRDFFPHLEKLKAQNDYLVALENNDAKKMRELYEKYSSGRPVTERTASPATFDTPLHDNFDISNDLSVGSEFNFQYPQTKRDISCDKNENKNAMGLDTYLNSYTSEDNVSFEEMMIESEQQRKMKYSWLYEMEGNSKTLAMKAKNNLLAVGFEKNERPLVPDTWGYRNQNFIMYIPNGVELTADEKIDMAKNKQEVIHDNTRLIANPFNEKQNEEAICELAKTQSKMNDGKIGVDGKVVMKNPSPKVNGFSFVATPSPVPGQCESPLMTWGEIEGTPFRLDGGDTPLLRSGQGPSFRMAEPPKREKIALQLAEKAGERHRDRKNKALEAARRSFATPSPRCASTIDQLSTMSPAARRLATQKLKVKGTPSPRRTPFRPPLLGVKTPEVTLYSSIPSKSANLKEETKSRSTVLTDNLLNLPQRQRASDFFN